jgi:hypothetical protein
MKNTIVLIAMLLLTQIGYSLEQDELKERVMAFSTPLEFCKTPGVLMRGEFLRKSCVSAFPCTEKRFQVLVQCLDDKGNLVLEVSGLPGGIAASKFRYDKATWLNTNGSILVSRFNVLQNSKLKPVILGITETENQMVVQFEVWKDNGMMQAGHWTLTKDSYLHQMAFIKEKVGFGVTSDNEYSLISVTSSNEQP